MDLPQFPLTADAFPNVTRYSGEVVYIYAFDIAYDMSSLPNKTLLGEPLVKFEFDPSKRFPRHMFVHRPYMVRLPPIQRAGPGGPVTLERTVKLLEVGAVSITIRVPFAVDGLTQLVAYHDLRLADTSLNQEVRHLADQIADELRPFSIRPHSLMDEEAYTVFCLHAPMITDDGLSINAEKWLKANRRAVAAVLTQEPGVDHLSEQEAEESTHRYLSYYEHDLVVVDWDASLVVDQPQNFEEVLHIVELANLQLAELEAYDRMLDGALERSYRDLSTRAFRARTAVMNELREIRIDLARFSDELLNITKFFGDWHLARIYKHLAERFHLPGWHRSIDEKLKTLDDLYQLLKHDQTNRVMLILEVTIVLLFILDLAMLFVGMNK